MQGLCQSHTVLCVHESVFLWRLWPRRSLNHRLICCERHSDMWSHHADYPECCAGRSRKLKKTVMAHETANVCFHFVYSYILVLCNVFGCSCCMKMFVCSLCVVKYACRHLPVLFRRMLCFLSTLAVFCGRLWVSSPMQAFANSSGIYFYLSCSSWLPLISCLTSVCLLCYFIFTVCHVTVTSFSCYHLQWWVSSANKKVFVEFNLILNIYYLFVHLWYIYIYICTIIIIFYIFSYIFYYLLILFVFVL